MTAWSFSDPITAETWVMPISPNKMTTPWPSKTLHFQRGSKAGYDRIRTAMSAPTVVQWQFGGVIRSQAHYDTLLGWLKREHIIHVSDHLGRTWQVLFQKLTIDERQPTALVPVRLNYTVQALNLGLVA